MANSIRLAFESLASAVTIQAFQSLIFFYLTFRSMTVDVYHVCSAVQVRPVVNFVALFFGYKVVVGFNDLSEHVVGGMTNTVDAVYKRLVSF